MKNKSLIALLAGFSMPIVIIPLINGIMELIEGVFEIIKGGQIKKITEINIENTKLAEELETLQTPYATSAIGFEVPSEEEYEVYEDDSCSCKNHIGF